MTRILIFVLISLFGILSFAQPASAQQKVQISGVQNVDFGLVSSLGADRTKSIDLCVYSVSGRYGVTASGTGPSSSFVMSSVTATLPYQVEWAATAGQSSGQILTANTRLSSQVTAAEKRDCSRGPTKTASLIVRLRAADLGTAKAGDYSGSLTVILAGE